ncbi:MAG: CRTAC1 family protein [Planctomycetes bacterium]|nr:CRTAC1 family protein [Planctomycetota bacterium]
MKKQMTLLGAFALMCSIFVHAPVGAGGTQPNYPIQFRDVTKASGLYEPLAGIMGHGAAVGDFDGDGKVDIYVGGFCDRPDSEYKPAKGPVKNYLFRNLGNGKFEIVDQPAISYFGRTSGAVFADLRNSGNLDLYAANNTKGKSNKDVEPQRSAQLRFAQLFRNDKGKFTDVSESSGACPKTLRTARNIGVLDYDGDGLLDLFVVEDKFIAKPSCRLFRNLGNMKFEDVTKEVGLPDDIHGLGCAIADLNGDGRPDIFVAHSNRLFLSQVKDGKTTYREDVELREVLQWKPLNNSDWPCGAVFADINNDGLLDLIVTSHHVKCRNKVFINGGLKNGIPQFRDVTKEVGLDEIVPVKCPHVEVQDFDNDGLPDIYTSAAWIDDKGNITPLIYRNLGIKNGLPKFAAPMPFTAPSKGEGSAGMVYFPVGPSLDFDGDGRIDLFLVNWFQGNHCRLMRNESAEKNWLDVKVEGKKMNRMGIGAQVTLFEPGTKKLLGFQEVTIGYGYASGQEAICHFGLNKIDTVNVEVRFPDGRIVLYENVRAKQRLKIAE